MMATRFAGASVKRARSSAGDAAWSALDGNAFDPAERVVEHKIIKRIRTIRFDATT